LPGDRVEPVAGVADQHEARRGDPRGVMEAERVRRARAVDRDRAEHAVHALSGLGGESAVASASVPAASRSSTVHTSALRACLPPNRAAAEARTARPG
jgi:hypothetical protein